MSSYTTRSAVLRSSPGRYEVLTLDQDAPRRNEVRVRMHAAGICHSDDHFATGDQNPAILPIVGGHEGAGVIEEVGPDTVGYAVGDHVVFSFLPVCGRCKWCSIGLQNLCNLGQHLGTGTRFDDPGTYRLSLDDAPVGQLAGLGTFSEHVVVSTASVITIDPAIPFTSACLTGCGVGTGWGSSVNAAEVSAGDVVIVMGVGGIGINAVQGAVHAGASAVIAVDPVAFKRDTAVKFGATDAYEDIAQAAERARELTEGQGADSAVVTTGVATGKHLGDALDAVRKGGTCVAVGLGDTFTKDGDINLHTLILHQKRLQGALFGQSAPMADIPKQLDLYRRGYLELDGLVTATYPLDRINDAFDDMKAGKNMRGVIVFD
ncbi:MAG: NDMA-dependent alcohol dehydrogenase [Gordonia sp. (in: high G+C Gram-positive bacteria)]|uniref:NDMA-dependent alcohol dehydrogenase n=1 Tax=Gordonia sp. (in: high G+C Gram-positive bacteria) TaxID=84139 RepID=UPI0039E6DBD3